MEMGSVQRLSTQGSSRNTHAAGIHHLRRSRFRNRQARQETQRELGLLLATEYVICKNRQDSTTPFQELHLDKN